MKRFVRKQPNYTKVADANDDGTLWSTLIYNGKNYGVTNPMDAVPMAMFWRKDWLDKLGLEVPETLDDYEKVLTAFVEEDPDGNGKKDTAGLAERAFGAVFGAYGLRCVTGGKPGFKVEEMQLAKTMFHSSHTFIQMQRRLWQNYMTGMRKASWTKSLSLARTMADIPGCPILS